MPYYFEALETSVSNDHLWDRLGEIWQVIHDDLMNVHFETEEEALAKTYSKSLDPNAPRFDSWNVARYRETDDRDNLLHFHETALEALGETELSIDFRSLDAHFLNQWTTLVSCHGFVVAALMARGDDLQSRRAGQASRNKLNLDAQQQWFSHYYLRARRAGLSREKAENAVEWLVNSIIDGRIAGALQLDVKWFERFLNLGDKLVPNPHYGHLTKSFRQAVLSEKRMQQLLSLPTADLPPLDLELPPP